jgi:hypothetical protein
MSKEYYTKEMMDSFNKIERPDGFNIMLESQGFFLKIKIDQDQYDNMTEDSKPVVYQYLNEVKKTLEDFNIKVLLVKEKWND